jgi:RimJ/RimL family protein N-acetyltransferase
MLRGEVAGLRARQDSDIPVLHAELYDDVAIRVQADSRPWRPIAAGSAESPYRRPAFRGRGLGTDAVRVLCRYGFSIRGLHRLQAETLAGNTAMITAATRAGFVPEGTLRRAAWVDGQFADEVILGLLDSEWASSRSENLGGVDDDVAEV